MSDTNANLSCRHYRGHVWECWWTDRGVDWTTALDSQARQSPQLTACLLATPTHIMDALSV